MCLYIFVPSARPASATHLWSKWVCSLGRHGESGNLHTHTHTHAQGRAVAVTCVVPIIPNQIRWRPRGAAGSGRAPPPGRAGGPVPAAARRAASRGDRAAQGQACRLRRSIERPRHLRQTVQGRTTLPCQSNAAGCQSDSKKSSRSLARVRCRVLSPQRLPSNQMPWAPVGAEADVHEWRKATKSEAPIVACAASEGFGCPFPPL